MTWSQEKIISRIYEAVDRFGQVDPQQYRQIKFALEKLGDDLVFESLYKVLTNPDRPSIRYLDQEYAGRLLFGLKPQCPASPEIEISKILANYDLSIEELPWYFQDMLDAEVLTAILERLRAKITDDDQLRALDTWQWWMRQWHYRDQGKEY